MTFLRLTTFSVLHSIFPLFGSTYLAFSGYIIKHNKQMAVEASSAVLQQTIIPNNLQTIYLLYTTVLHSCKS